MGIVSFWLRGTDQILSVGVLRRSTAVLFPVMNFNYYFETLADGTQGSQSTLPCIFLVFLAFVFQAGFYLER